MMPRAPTRLKDVRSSGSLRCSVLAAMTWTPLLGGCAASGTKSEYAYFPPAPAVAHVVHLKSFNSLDSLVRRRATFVERLRGQPAVSYAQNPTGIAYSDNHLYICDTGLRVLHDWNLETGVARRIGESGAKRLEQPVDVCVDSQRTLFVADTGRGEVVSFDASGRNRRAFKPPDRTANRPTAVACMNEHLYVSDAGSSQIDVFSTQDGTHQATFAASTGADSEAYALPTGLGISESRVFVSDMTGGRVLAFSREGKFVRQIGERGDRYGDMGQPKHLAIGSDGILFVADAEFARVHLFNEAGQLLMLLGGSGSGPGSTPMPFGVAVAPTLPRKLAALVPKGFTARYFLFVTNSVGPQRISLFAIGEGR